MDIATLGLAVDSRPVTTASSELDKLTAAASRAEQSANKFADAIDKAGDKAATGTKRASAGANETSDSFRNLMATGVASYLGGSVVQGAIAAGEALFKASVSAQNLRVNLDFASGGRSATEIEYLRKVTNGLGLEFASTADAYGKFAAAARGTTLEGKAARDVFESVAKSAAVMGLSADQSSGVLLALQQMISKGTVQSEELRGQLGERLPGAFQIAAKAMNVTTGELGKMLEQGQVVAGDFLPKFAAALNDNIGTASESAAQRLEASSNRMSNAWDRLKQNVGDSGISSALASGMAKGAASIDYISISMEKARANGAGFVGQLFAMVGAYNDMTDPGERLTKNMAVNSEAIKLNEQRLKDLQAQAAQGIDVKVKMDDLQKWIDKLKQARVEFAAFSQMGPIEAQYPSRGSQASYDRDQKAIADETKAYLQQDARQTQAQKRAEEIEKAEIRAGVLIKKQLDDQKAVKAIQDALVVEVANINDKYKDKKPSTAGAASLERQEVGIDIDSFKRSMDKYLAEYARGEQLLDAQRSAGLIGEKDYYDQKRHYIDLTTEAKVDEMESENGRYEKEKATGARRVELQRDIQNNLLKIETVQADAAGRKKVLDLQETASLAAKASAYLSLRQASEGYLATQERSQNRTLQGLTQGDTTAAYLSGRNQIDDKYDQQRRDAQNARAIATSAGGGVLTSDQTKQFQDQLDLIDEFQKKSIQSFDRYWGTLQDRQGDWATGAERAFNRYSEAGANVAGLTETAFSNAFTGLEDALVTFATTGKLSFTGLANSIIADLVRIQLRTEATSLMKGAGGFAGLLKMLGLGGSTVDSNPGGAANMIEFADYGYAEGGPTPPGGKYKAVGIVHAGENVWSQADVARAGGMQVVEAMRLGRRGYADGGAVDTSFASTSVISAPPSGTASAAITYAPVINIDSRTDRAAVEASTQRALAENNKQFMKQLQRMGVVAG
ncbi:phage tail tape measure protein [Xylophilus rhododendri]|uniref:Phage tail tape measure protein n=1 Tax=Xylophilus rhododendri TaxID=2697032 RepID=A0A857J7U9_9BURK|nr:phage tail tape measure protein [Xylophilus rhododendri]QHJ00121.1 phage tail tape measure protein [Xylophilus rhododendri]